MDVKITQTQSCGCGQGVISITGVCGECIFDGAVQFWTVCGAPEVVCRTVRPVPAAMSDHKRNWGFEATK